MIANSYATGRHWVRSLVLRAFLAYIRASGLSSGVMSYVGAYTSMSMTGYRLDWE